METGMMFQGVDKDSTAFKLMKQMGWREGTGLGKDQQGIKQHVRVKKKNDNSGLGVDEKEKAARNWTFNTSTFDDILKNLRVVADPDLREEKQNSSAVIDEEQKTTKKAARPQGRYKRREGSKLVRGYSQTDLQEILGHAGAQNNAAVSVNSEGQIKSETTDPRVSTDETSLPKPNLRKVKIEVKEELITEELKPVKKELDLKPVKKELVLKPVEQKPMVVQSRIKQEVLVATEEVTIQQRTVSVKLESLGCAQNVLALACEEAQPVSQEPLASNWWGNSFGFVRGGQLGSQQRQSQVEPGAAANESTAFCEQDQENLYKLVQDKATTGKQGLGIGDRPRKIGGAHYKGQKITFQNDDDDGGGSVNGRSDNQNSNCTTAPKDWCLQPGADKRKREGEVPSVSCDKGEAGTNPEASSNKVRRKEGHEIVDAVVPGGRLKWKTVCKEILQEAPTQTMSLKRLKKRLSQTVSVLLDKEGSAFDLKKKIEGSSQFRIDGKNVVLTYRKLAA
eukprot:TRINITY_DN7783_c0_g1_i1.p1 TRINITY_DN7783_c0_g1~~TRINITY_DN7783_c0_g1_i1.p1  ORF type:complete len:507 (+),score=115.59 TRINITY_DN7783_c0_g1_i1:282-1802(+)